ncbi:hypothetical protein BN1263160153 [Stenotrophomonas indicatrix]|nr:hypothetical protein BN1263160153 [Stenotrophomonas indicatrix]
MLAEHMVGSIEDEGSAGSGIGTLGGHGFIFGHKCPDGERRMATGLSACCRTHIFVTDA